MNAKTQRTALWLFFSLSAVSFAVTLWHHHADEHHHANEALQAAAWDGDLPRVQEALRRGADVNVRDDDLGHTPLMYAAEKRNVGIAQVLLAHGASVNVIDYSDNSVLPLAAAYGSESVVALLLKNGADLSDENLRQALDCAYLYPRIAALLKEAQAQRRKQTTRA